ncbi:MBL fold metallo-hydrolase [Frondihabitans sp. PAMC 28766]|uniref:MBL fold metallo-hydrolase n=1 Tax=Frondihabitans sp. PAMC 28766 TaxID=1795630 RepID=UPI00078E6B03|nr:MBL fold metallo-hydrolase [Frondihabitans sp. PAMC 28766]AMM21552.1 MBL fold metallo-hydrolase [Frondihabitans sp. PAMC 28766]
MSDSTPAPSTGADFSADAPPIIDPEVRVENAREIASDLVVIENRGVDLVPNIGVIGGSDAVLVVDTGMGIENATAVLAFAMSFAAGRRLYLTTTHFHPEHAFGAQVFTGHATYLVNRAQAIDLEKKSAGYLQMFAGLSPVIATRLAGVVPATPDIVFDGVHDLDLGGRIVQLRPTGQGHTLGDQVVIVPDVGVLFTGDLVESDQFPIFPWFPPYDVDVNGSKWIAVMDSLISLDPKIVVPGHGDIRGVELLAQVRGALAELRSETLTSLDAGLSDATVTSAVVGAMVSHHPAWAGREWIPTAVAALVVEARGTSRV